jgi:hypothetical protein
MTFLLAAAPPKEFMSSTPPPDSLPDFLQVLGLLPPVTVEDVKQAYRSKVKSTHPDAGGSEQEFQLVQQAFDRALEYAEFRAGRMAWLGAHIEQYTLQQALIAELERQGAVVEIEEIDWLRRSFGDDFAQVVDRVVGLKLCGSQFDDETITHLLSERRVLERLYWLDLSGSRVTDRGVRLLSAFEFLGRLDLRQTAVTASGLEVIGSLEDLQWIGLPDRALNLWERWQLRWQHSKLHFAEEGEVCAARNKQGPINPEG